MRTLCGALVFAILILSPTRAERGAETLPDGSRMEVVATFRVVSRVAGKREVLRIWTTQTGIPMGGETWFQGSVEDEAGRLYRPTRNGPIYQGPTPKTYREVWIVSPSPPPGRLTLRLHSRREQSPVFEAELTESSTQTIDFLMAEATDRNDVEMITQLLRQGARPHIRGEEGLTPLMIAATAGDLALARALLDQGVAVDARAYYPQGPTALVYAAMWSTPEMVRLVLSRGADPNLPAFGQPPVTLARWLRKEANARELLAAGARPQERPPIVEEDGQSYVHRRHLRQQAPVANAPCSR